MKKSLVLLFCFFSVALFAQGEQFVIDKFTGIFMAVSGVVFIALTWLATKVPFIAKIANLKLVSAIVSSVVAIVGVFIAGIPPLTLGAALSAATFLFNLIRGWIDSNNGQTIEAKQLQDDADTVALKELKINS